MDIIDTRDLIEERNKLKDLVLDYFNSEFKTDLDDYYTIPKGDHSNEVVIEADVSDFINTWQNEITQIAQIDNLEDEVNSYAGDNFEDGVTLIDDDNLREDYTEVEFRGTTYLYK
jgi:hypothetical protein